MLRLHGAESVSFSTWLAQLRLRVLRRVMGGGLQSHLRTNLSVRGMFRLGGVVDEAPDKLSAIEKVRVRVQPSHTRARVRRTASATTVTCRA